MKRTIILMLCLAALISCEMKDRGTDIDLSGHTVFNVDMEAISMAGDFPEQRVWKQGDMIGVFGSEQGENVGFYLKEASQGGTIAEFYGPLVKGDQIKAYFPYDRALVAEPEGLPCELAAIQTYDPRRTALQHFLAYSSRAFAVMDASKALHFAYPFGMLEIIVAMDEPVLMTGASLLGQNFISGKFLVDESCQITSTDLSLNRITLDFEGKEVWSREEQECAVLHFLLPPAYYAAGNLTLELNVKEGQNIAVQLEELFVERVDCSEFSVTSITVGLADIPELDIKDGYLE